MKNEQIKLYEKLLNEKDEVEKESIYTHIKYMKKFGNLLVKEYELQIETIKYKKMIAYCAKKRNYGQAIDKNELDDYIDNVMISYNSKLGELTINNKFAHEKKELIDGSEYSRIKNLYRMIVHMTHPDLHPELKDNKEISELWNKVVIAYKSNNLNDLILLYDKIILLINKDDEFNIENIEAKIKVLEDEIEYIKTNEPYIYKSILNNKDKVKNLKAKLNNSIDSYAKYLIELKNKMKEFDVIYEA